MAALLYLATGIATAIPVVWALGWAVWGAGISITEYISLLGSLILVASAPIRLLDRRTAARTALIGAACIWTFYLPGVFSVGKTLLTDQELTLSILLWTPSNGPLAIDPMPNPAAAILSDQAIRQIRATGIGGTVSSFGSGRYGSGKKSAVILVMQRPIHEPVELREPDASSVVYVQEADGWKMFPPNAPRIRRTIRIEPLPEDHRQSIVMVELATGARQGFGVWWPKTSSGSASK
ncbi:MAG TPA: hypothetical protein VJN43_06895 [Bryobacteraceae bacterium]|nr:hypothetical protein [Bryobacteraceae bacterium]